MNSRRQLTLFVPSPASSILEPVRQRVDPIQHRLIPAHVTLCRDDELIHLPVGELGERLALADRSALTLQFGPPETFSGHGVLLPCIAGELPFRRLRVALLGSNAIRAQHPHITLAHPRNPRAPENVATTYASLVGPLTMTFTRVCLITQDHGRPWVVRQEHDLMPSDA